MGDWARLKEALRKTKSAGQVEKLAGRWADIQAEVAQFHTETDDVLKNLQAGLAELTVSVGSVATLKDHVKRVVGELRK